MQDKYKTILNQKCSMAEIVIIDREKGVKIRFYFILVRLLFHRFRQIEEKKEEKSENRIVLILNFYLRFV